MSEQQPASAAAPESASIDPIDLVIHYHLKTKHHFNRYARSLGYLDWANQPDPFRRFQGADILSLPRLKPDEDPASPAYDAIYWPDTASCQPVSLRTLSRFLEFALALSAWKRAGESEWALRSNPSSGNLHPTEGYLVLPKMEGLDLEPGLYHYAPKEHGIERRASFPPERIARLLAGFPVRTFLIGFTSVHWREAWKYGERAFRYCNHDVGHAIGTARIAAATLGWNMTILDEVEQNTIALLLGTNRHHDFAEAEAEHPDCLAAVWPLGLPRGDGRRAEAREKEKEIPLFLDPALVKELVNCSWQGKANRLSQDHAVHWSIIDQVAHASWKTHADKSTIQLTTSMERSPRSPFPLSPTAVLAGQIIRQRRSAVSFDGKTSISAEAFFRMMRLTVPEMKLSPLTRSTPWDVWPYDPTIHLMLFVHRVDGLTPGLYFLVRDPGKLDFIQRSMNAELSWTKTPGAPEDLPLYWLLEGDAQQLATQVSCHQEIAGAGAFSCGMLAEFEGRLRERGAWWYPRMFWESGLLGQLLYLEAEAAGVRATGIGCFFDDPVHEIISVKGLTLQSLYHFTIGGPVEDRRLTTLPPYFHLEKQ